MPDGNGNGAGSGDVLIRRRGRAGRITLNRPRSLNLLTRAMVRKIHTALDLWRDDPAVDLLVIDAEGRTFCAGGDIIEVHALVGDGKLSTARTHIRREFLLDLAIARYPKPVVAIMDGAVMGGGVGLGCHASHRVAASRFRLALPECAIGWIPDSGASARLARTPFGVGELMALTGLQIDAADALDLGFVDHVLESSSCMEAIDALCASGDPGCLGSLSAPAGPTELREQVARLRFPDGLKTPATLAKALRRAGEDPAMSRWCARQLKALARGAPFAQALALRTLEAQRRRPGLARALATEFRIVSSLLTHPDFHEGIRAAITDRDKKPVWCAPTDTGVSGADLDALVGRVRDRGVIRKFIEDPAK